CKKALLESKNLVGVSNVRLAKIMEVADLLYLLDFKNLTDLNSITFDTPPKCLPPDKGGAPSKTTAKCR
ncbi:MAG: hypothetical protein R2825_02615, partial [Saprospiraceae bacterium]